MPATRREFVRTLATTAAAATAAQAQSQHPNILFIFSDQHRACSLPGQPFNDAEAPHFAQMATDGVSFANCISNYPVCSPYRGILMSGKWPYESGVIDNAFPLKEEDISLGDTFKSAGYRTGYVGKWHLDARGTEGKSIKPVGSARHGFDEWRAWYNTNPHYDKSFTYHRFSGQREQPKGYNATLMADDAIGFIRRRDDNPWMLVLSWNPPHSPFHDAPANLLKKYKDGSLQLRPNTTERIGNRVHSDQRGVREDLAGYNAHIEAIDIEMGRILRALDETGQARNTIVVYTSDHGEMMGAKGRMGKRLPHEESCNVPFIVRQPGTLPTGLRSDALLSAIDIYPTLCGLAGIDIPEHCRGQDLSPVIRGDSTDGPETSFLMHIEKDHSSGGRNHPAPIFRGIRTRRHTYAVGQIGRWMLYDNQEDPYQQHNLAEDPTRASLMSDLDGELQRYLREAQDKFPLEALRAKRNITSA